jgi:hypothetical protein
MSDMPGTVDRLLDRLPEHHSSRSHQVLATQSNDRVQAKGVFGGLKLKVIVILVTHLRRSIVL